MGQFGTRPVSSLLLPALRQCPARPQPAPVKPTTMFLPRPMSTFSHAARSSWRHAMTPSLRTTECTSCAAFGLPLSASDRMCLFSIEVEETCWLKAASGRMRTRANRHAGRAGMGGEFT